MTLPSSYTVVVASNRGEREIQFVVSTAWVKASAFLGFAFLLFVTTAAVDYVGLMPSLRENADLIVENKSLKERRLILEKNLSSIQTELERVHALTTKLKIITKAGGEPSPIVTPARDPASTPPFVSEESAAEPMAEESPPVLADQVTAPVEALSHPLPQRVESALQESQLREQELMNTWGMLSDRQSLLSAIPSIKPAHGYYSSPFGYRYDPINGRPLLHAGVDIAAPWGTQVLAPADGVVSFAGYDGGYGYLVAIDHGYGVTTRFGHNSKLFVHPGQRVRRWETISLVGSTGHSTGAHVHYEVRVHGLPVDPINYILQEN